MTLQDRGGQLMEYLSQLSACVDICCECIEIIATGTCSCISGGPFPGGVVDDATLSVTIPGDVSECTAPFTPPPPCAPVAGINFAGTYLLTCDAEAISPGVKIRNVRQGWTFICTRGSVDFYVFENCQIRLQFSPVGGFATVSIIFSTGTATFNTGDDPEVDTPITSSAGGSTTYSYQWLPDDYTDGCGNVSPSCGELTLISTVTSSGDCSHSSAVGDYAPTIVRIGNP